MSDIHVLRYYCNPVIYEIVINFLYHLVSSKFCTLNLTYLYQNLNSKARFLLGVLILKKEEKIAKFGSAINKHFSVISNYNYT